MERKEKKLASFGRNLKDLRHEKGLTQERLAELADIDRTYIYRLESSLRLPSLPVVVRLAKAFGQTPGQFLDKMVGRN